MGRSINTRAAVVIGLALGACTPSGRALESDEPDAIVYAGPVVPLAAGAPASAPTIETPAELGPAVVPRIVVRVRGEGEECEITIEAQESFPAYDPATDQVVVVERYDRKMSSFDDEIVVRWKDATTGVTVESEMIVGDHGALSCDKADRRARRRLARIDERLAAGRWEAMEAVPLRVVNDDSYANYRDLAADKGADPEDVATFREELMPRGQVHAVLAEGGLMIRLPGVKVYERDLPSGGIGTLHEVRAHRPSGVVVLTHRSCRDEDDCTCNLEDDAAVMRWSTATLDAITRHPCVPEDDRDAGCDIASLFDG